MTKAMGRRAGKLGNSKEAVKSLFIDHYDRMYLLARIMLHDDEESRDAVSDVFASIVNNRIEVKADTAQSFLLTCVRNKCLKIVRSKQVRQRASRLLQLDDSVEMMLAEEQTDRLSEVLDYSRQELTPQTLRVFQMRYQHRKTYAEIAEELGISEAAVYKHLAQALTKIKNHFNP